MCRDYYNTQSSKGEHITREQRIKIAHLYNYQNKNYTEIGE
ncbi:MAG TPA: hypothetical protein VJ962_09390 [Clostridia bacterium]|nr:hypothetical protein [Clostridia bacterium]